MMVLALLFLFFLLGVYARRFGIPVGYDKNLLALMGYITIIMAIRIVTGSVDEGVCQLFSLCPEMKDAFSLLFTVCSAPD